MSSDEQCKNRARVYKKELKCDEPEKDSAGKPTGKLGGYGCRCVDESDGKITVIGHCVGFGNCHGDTDASGKRLGEECSISISANVTAACRTLPAGEPSRVSLLDKEGVPKAILLRDDPRAAELNKIVDALKDQSTPYSALDGARYALNTDDLYHSLYGNQQLIPSDPAALPPPYENVSFPQTDAGKALAEIAAQSAYGVPPSETVAAFNREQATMNERYGDLANASREAMQLMAPTKLNPSPPPYPDRLSENVEVRPLQTDTFGRPLEEKAAIPGESFPAYLWRQTLRDIRSLYDGFRNWLFGRRRH